mgnify:CR=1 FL=1
MLRFSLVDSGEGGAVDDDGNAVLFYEGIDGLTVGDVQLRHVREEKAASFIVCGSQCLQLAAQLSVAAGNEYMFHYALEFDRFLFVLEVIIGQLPQKCCNISRCLFRILRHGFSLQPQQHEAVKQFKAGLQFARFLRPV